MLLLFVAPLGLTFSILKVKQWQVREQIKQEILLGMDKGELVQFSFSKQESDELDWEHEREFMYNGQSYDVVEKEVKGDSITYYVWWDKVETRIKTQLAELVAIAMNSDGEQQSNQNQLDKLLKSVYWKNLTLELTNEEAEGTINVGPVLQQYNSLQWAPPVPPPLYV